MGQILLILSHSLGKYVFLLFRKLNKRGFSCKFAFRMESEQNPNSNQPAVDKNTQRFTLRKEEKLRHKTLVGALFENGESLYEYPLRAVWRVLSPEQLKGSFKTDIPPRVGSLQMLITVPKKKRRHAVDRVLMRRRIREAYRLNRLPLKKAVEVDESVALLEIAFIYMSDTNLPYSTVEKKMQRILLKILSKIQQPSLPE